ncbi:MAG TPA: gamma-glutamylcyclotransferase [bacterium]|nr:gamma-glutamylcyclotransferase [bacterium]
MPALEPFNLFIYGSLRDSHVFMEVTGIPCPDKIPAVLEGYTPGAAVCGYPAAIPKPDSQMKGEVIPGLPPEILARLDAYEGEGELYRRVCARVKTALGEMPAYVYIRNPER